MKMRSVVLGGGEKLRQKTLYITTYTTTICCLNEINEHKLIDYSYIIIFCDSFN